ncbi:MAG TPA: 4-hydroxy-3-methylbut-2-enyl diphosphate reductase [Dehalococcoidia bacterium]|nr:4-hydroxy-3-methylbut-2-enyl diphosphate reductase [Dehalococcoidia bacterium]
MALTVRTASSLGFCFGVRRAIEMVEDAAEERGRIDSLGSIVHNPVVAERLNKRGVAIVPGFDGVGARSVAITAHGAGPDVYRKAGGAGLDLVDTTCPIVARAQRAARRLVNSGFKVIIYGDANHPEVRGVLAWTRGRGVVLADAADPVEIPRRKVALLSQTTKSQQAFTDFVARFLALHIDRINEVRVINTTCPETEDRYEAARELAREVELMVVIGGRNSANTAKLAATCRAAGVETYQVEREDEIDGAWIAGKQVVGVTAGASTPDESVAAVVRRLKQLDRGSRAKERRRAG